MTGASNTEALANLYSEAARYVAANWGRGRLETRSRAIHSSQALCVSVLITLRHRSPERRLAVTSAIAERAGLHLPLASPPEIDAEVRKHGDLLGEVGGGTPTALDGLVTSPEAVLTIESKFTEREFGACGQIKPATVKPHDERWDPNHPDRRFVNCTRLHGIGSDRKPTTMHLGAACRLTVQDGKRQRRRYWDVAPHLFLPSVLTTPQPCPFRTDAYQLMRNLAFAHEWAQEHNLPWFGFMVALADRAPKADELRDRVADFKLLLKPRIRERVGIVSYQDIADVLDSHSEPELARWVRQRLAAVVPA